MSRDGSSITTESDIGSITDIVMSSFTSPPQVTDNVEVIVNLDSEGSDNSAGSAMTSLSSCLERYSYAHRWRILLMNIRQPSVHTILWEAHTMLHFILIRRPLLRPMNLLLPAIRLKTTGPELLLETSTWAGLLARGLINFDSSGSMTDIDLCGRLDPADPVASAAQVRKGRIRQTATSHFHLSYFQGAPHRPSNLI